MFTTKTKLIVGGCLLAILAVAGHADALFGIEAAHAVVLIPGTGGGVSGMLGKDLVDFMGKLAMFNTFLHILLLIILQFLGYLLQADFFNDQQMMGALYSIWRLSRDIMNIIFAVMLIGVSFFVIITAKSEMIKEKIVNFVVAVILVNMSWFFPRVIIDVANVLTAAVYSVPGTLGFTCNTFNDADPPVAEPCKVITKVIIFPSAAEQAACPTCKCITGVECHEVKPFATEAPNMKAAHAMINGLAVSFAKITLLPKIPSSIGAGLTTGTTPALLSLQIAMNIVMALLIQMGVVLPLLGLAVGLFIRIIILWVTTAFMPFSFLGYAVNGKLGTNIFGLDDYVWKEFLAAAFLPTLVAIPFTIGFVMLSAAATMTAPPLAGFPLTMSVPLISGVKSWWAMLWLLAAVGIMWIGAFTALRKSQIIGKFTDKIKNFGESVFGGIIQAPLILPLPIGLGGGKGANLGTLVHGPKLVADAVKLTASGTTGKNLGEILGDKFSGGGKGAPASAAELATRLQNDNVNTKKVVDAINHIKAGGSPATAIQDLKIATGQTGRDTVESLVMLRDAMNQSKAGSALRDAALMKPIEDLITAEKAKGTPPPTTPAP